MADTQILAAGTSALPLSYTVPNAQEIEPLAAFATFDGTGASGAFLPTLQIISDAGLIVADMPADSQVAAGGSAPVTWAPFLGGGTAIQTITTIAATSSGQTIVPLAQTIGIRTVQPSPANFGASTAHFGFRVVIPRSGVLHDLAVYISSPAGSVEVAILSTTATTRTILFKTGLIGVTANHAYQVFGDPAMTVQAGDQFDIVYTATNAGNTIMWIGGLVNTGTDAPSAQLPPNFVPAPNGATNLICWNDTVSPIPYGATVTVAEASLAAQQNIPLVVGRISDS